jgi:hypothetical protein
LEWSLLQVDDSLLRGLTINGQESERHHHQSAAEVSIDNCVVTNMDTGIVNFATGNPRIRSGTLVRGMAAPGSDIRKRRAVGTGQRLPVVLNGGAPSIRRAASWRVRES